MLLCWLTQTQNALQDLVLTPWNVKLLTLLDGTPKIEIPSEDVYIKCKKGMSIINHVSTYYGADDTLTTEPIVP